MVLVFLQNGLVVPIPEVLLLDRYDSQGALRGLPFLGLLIEQLKQRSLERGLVKTHAEVVGGKAVFPLQFQFVLVEERQRIVVLSQGIALLFWKELLLKCEFLHLQRAPLLLHRVQDILADLL